MNLNEQRLVFSGKIKAWIMSLDKNFHLLLTELVFVLNVPPGTPVSNFMGLRVNNCASICNITKKKVSSTLSSAVLKLDSAL